MSRLPHCRELKAREEEDASPAPEAKPLRPFALFSSLLPSIHSSSFVLLNKKQAGVPLTERMNVGEAEWVWQEETFLHVSIGGILGSPQSSRCTSVPHLSAWTVTFHNRKATVSQTITFNIINPFISKNKHSCNKQTKNEFCHNCSSHALWQHFLFISIWMFSKQVPWCLEIGCQWKNSARSGKERNRGSS